MGWLHSMTGSALLLSPVASGLISTFIFLGKVFTLIFIFMWVRWTVPRFRYDQVMRLGWQKLLPLSIVNLIAYTIGIALLQH
jgi:NADH-quinone oxidoreductase subunit H